MSKVLVNFIQDRSGSMQSVWEETLIGFKKFVQDLKDSKDDVEYKFSLTTFDTIVDAPIVAEPIANVSVDALAAHRPRGGTALYDAVGSTIKHVEEANCAADKIIVVIVTDGQENSSREWTKERLQLAIEGKLKLGNWTFTYLGTQPETWDDAGAIGVAAGSVASYTPRMAHAAYAATSHAVRAMSASPVMCSTSLMTDFVPEKMERSAGMNVHRTSPSPTANIVKPPKKVPDSKRWR